MWGDLMNSVGRCERGICRNTNEDAIFIFDSQYGCLPNLYILADGMGGHKAGEIASSSAIEFFCEYIHENRVVMLKENYEYLDIIKKAILFANDKIYNKSKTDEDFEGMGTTFVVASILNNKLLVENIGDSRLYIVRDEEIIQITVDHTYVMELLKKGKITETEVFNHPNKNAITRAVGTEEKLDIDTFEIELHKNDIIMMCSDGLTNMLTDTEILDIVLKSDTIEEAAKMLVDQSNENGGVDNISVILINGFKEEVK
jgi:protein phosphatase